MGPIFSIESTVVAKESINVDITNSGHSDFFFLESCIYMNCIMMEANTNLKRMRMFFF